MGGLYIEIKENSIYVRISLLIVLYKHYVIWFCKVAMIISILEMKELKLGRFSAVSSVK